MDVLRHFACLRSKNHGVEVCCSIKIEIRGQMFSSCPVASYFPYYLPSINLTVEIRHVILVPSLNIRLLSSTAQSWWTEERSRDLRSFAHSSPPLPPPFCSSIDVDRRNLYKLSLSSVHDQIFCLNFQRRRRFARHD